MTYKKILGMIAALLGLLLINILAYSLPPVGVDGGRKGSATVDLGARSN
jgi:hypothetical protein